MAVRVEYHHCPLCGVQPYNVPAVNHVLHFLVTVLSCGFWIFVWIGLALGKPSATCASCGRTFRAARRLAKREDRQEAREEAREHYNAYGPEVGARVKVTGGEFAGRYGTVVENDGVTITIADKKGRKKALPLRDFQV